MTMQGAHQAKYFVNSYLESDLPNRLVTYRNAWNLDDEELPEPTRYITYEPIAIDHWPMLITVAMSMNGLERKDYTSAFDPQFFVEYAMRTYVWVKDNSSEMCTLKRDRLVTVLRSAFLDAPSLNRCSESVSDTLYARIDEGGIREEYSELTLIKGERVMAGAYLSYNLTLNEVSTLAPLGTLASWDVQEYSIGIEDNFPES
jgi:hypothetical protein